MLSLTLWIVLAAVVILIAFLLYIYTRLPKKIPVQFRGKHAFITGGSKGIGKELAIGLIKRGCNVSISARDAKQLQLTCDELRTVAQSTAQANISARWYQLDVTDSFEKVEAVILKAEKECGKEIDILINNAGTCIQGAFDELSTEAFQQQFSLNCLSSIKTTHALVKRMKLARNGHIGFVCSAAGQFAMFGYSAYSMSKFALRGFAESLRMELLPYNIGVSLLYPPNTSTEGYQEELKTMPDEVREISGVAGLFTARHVAECYLNDMASGNISTSIGLEGWMLNAIASATSMENNFLRVLLELILLVPIRIIMLIYMSDVNKIVDECRSKRQSCNTSTNGPSVNAVLQIFANELTRMAKKKATVRFADDEDVRQNQRSTQRNRKLSVSAPQRAFSASELSEDERMILQSRRSSTRIPGTPSLIARTPQPLLPESERFSSNLRQRPSIDRFQVAVISRTPPPSTSLNSRRRQRAQSKSDETTPNYDRSQQKPPDLTNDSNLQTIMKSGSLEPEPLLNPMNSTNSKTRNNGPKTLANDPSLRANDEVSDNKKSSVDAIRSSLSPLSPLPATYKSKQQQDFDTESAVVELTKQQPNNQSQVDYEQQSDKPKSGQKSRASSYKRYSNRRYFHWDSDSDSDGDNTKDDDKEIRLNTTSSIFPNASKCACEDGEDCELCRLGKEYKEKYDKAKGKQKASDMIMKDLGVLDEYVKIHSSE